jgi:hypothetical protein
MRFLQFLSITSRHLSLSWLQAGQDGLLYSICFRSYPVRFHAYSSFRYEIGHDFNIPHIAQSSHDVDETLLLWLELPQIWTVMVDFRDKIQ